MTENLKEQMNEYYLTHTLNETAAEFSVSKSTIKKYASKKRVFLTDVERIRNMVKTVVKRRQRIKELAIEYKGGKCIRCGYSKYNGALEFHHTDPARKDFSVSTSGHCKAWEKVKKELDKCMLVCSNCHREIHNEIHLAKMGL